ncbi:MAG: peptide chain release factor 2 [Aerococcus sp.]|nr:peptide chain release factor 2 [Aerococcus sp.]
MEFSEIRNLLDHNHQQLLSFRGSLDLEELAATIAENEDKMLAPDFWDNSQKAQQVIQNNNALKAVYDTFHDLESEWEDLNAMAELSQEEEDGALLLDDLTEQLLDFQRKMKNYERQLLLDGEHDHANALLEIHAGAGGTEAQDWADMLLRMYRRWAEQHDYKLAILDYQAGDEAGVKSVAIEVSGHNAYGLLQSEHGVHRLVRISPFDTNSRRHTSFASVEVMPELDQETEIDINPDDIRVDVFRSSGAGGQHINKTSSAVRLTHEPTGIVVSSQNQRSQLQNRETAMRMLQAKLARLLEEKNAQELDEIRGEKAEIAWGSQIRSYVFHPYQMVKDHRTNYETSDTTGVMDGDLDPFIDQYLKWKLEQKNNDAQV